MEKSFLTFKVIGTSSWEKICEALMTRGKRTILVIWKPEEESSLEFKILVTDASFQEGSGNYKIEGRVIGQQKEVRALLFLQPNENPDFDFLTGGISFTSPPEFVPVGA